MKSIRNQLLLWLIGGMLLSTFAAGISMYWIALDEASELFDYQIKQVSLSLLNQSDLPIAERDNEDPEEDNFIQIWNAQGKLLFASHPSHLLPRYAGSGLHTVNIKQQPWRLYISQRNGRFIQVAQPVIERQKLAAGIAIRMLIPFSILIPLLSILIWIVVDRSLLPLKVVTKAVAQRDADAMQPIPDQSLPQEIRPLVTTLNQLLQRLALAIHTQRTFIADAAHELRTPLTALKLQIELTERASTEQQRLTAFAKLNQRLYRSIHLVKQLLTLARSEPQFEAQLFQPVNLSELAQQVVNDFTLLAEQRNINIHTYIEPDVFTSGQVDSLHILISNLVDNAILYTPMHGKVEVHVNMDHAHPILRIIDTGSGIPANERERVFDRFYRCEGTEVVGSGLGLSIVRNIAEIHSAMISLSNNLDQQGLVVTIKF